MYDDNSYRKRSYKHLVKYYDLLQNWQKTTIHCRNISHDTIRDAILTYAQKPTRVSLIYRTEQTTKK